MTGPIHCGQSQGRGVEIYSGSDCIGRATTAQDAHTLALAMLIGPQKIGGVLIEAERIRLQIARDALDYIIQKD